LGKGNYSKIVFIVNPSFISQKEIGFLPGSKHEKILPFMEGIMDNLNFLFNNSVPDDFNILKTDLNEYFEIRPISFIRG
jgi:predicted ribonuclease YlaK